jgi:tRNA A37 methylthiotransferase MiaB
MKEYGDRNNYRFREKMLGKIYKVFPVRKIDKDDKLYYGFTPNYIRVLFSKEPFFEPVFVRITKITNDRTYGEKV